ncbi:MAG: hypothetical protein ACI8WB_003472, partial [Phenylobacterium sp.]
MSQDFSQLKEWSALVKLLKSGLIDNKNKPILWVGAGLSVPAGYPTTPQLIKKLADESFTPLPAFTPEDETLPVDSVNRSFTHWVQHFAEENDNKHLQESLARIFLNAPKEPTVTHQHLVQLPWHAIFTTNYDELLEEACRATETEYMPISQQQNLGLKQNERMPLYKIHGSVNNIASWTLGEQSYLDYADQYPFLDTKLKDTLFNRRIIYIGCSMLDPKVIDWYRYCEKHGQLNQLKFAIVIIKRDEWAKLPPDLLALYTKAKVRPLLFDDFDDLPKLAEQLMTAVQTSEQIEAVVEPDWTERQQREDRAIEKLLYVELIPQLVGAIAGLWLKAAKGEDYLDRLEQIGGFKTRNRGEITFKSLSDEFVELMDRLIGKKTEFVVKQAVFNEITTVLKQQRPYDEALERIKYDP